jgi:hypothetical protein
MPQPQTQTQLPDYLSFFFGNQAPIPLGLPHACLDVRHAQTHALDLVSSMKYLVTAAPAQLGPLPNHGERVGSWRISTPDLDRVIPWLHPSDSIIVY